MVKEEFCKSLSSKIDEIESLAALESSAPRFNSWRKSTEELIREYFGEGNETESFNAIFYSPLFLSCSMDDTAFTESYLGGLKEARAVLETILRKAG